MPIAFAAVGGLIAGSFLNVVIARLPDGQSLVRPRSRCPHCGAAVRPYDNVPVLSWLILRGRCRDCGEPISARYPLVEALTAVLLAAVVARFGADEDALLGLALVIVLVPVTFIDLERQIIPNKLVLAGAIAAVVVILAATDPDELPEHLIAGAAAGGFLLVAALAYPRGMGMGDVKLAAMLGLFLGASIAPAMLAAMLSGSIAGGVIIARKGTREGRKTKVPFGPFLALGALVGLFVGPEIVDWYSDTFL
jgi:leader peptidase (prepilin peptidase) / N-methyltransferase